VRMVAKDELEELVELLRELRNEIDWAERADKPLPAGLAEGTEDEWRARCEEGEVKAPELLAKAKDLIDRIDWTRIE